MLRSNRGWGIKRALFPTDTTYDTAKDVIHMTGHSIKLMTIAAVFAAFATAMTCSCACAAQEMHLSLEESVQMALQNNRAIEQAAEDREAARWSLSEARRNAGPTVAWQMSGMRIGGKSYASAREAHDAYGTPSYDNEFTHALSVTLPVYTGGQLEGQRDAARFGLNAADLSLENVRQEVRYRAKAAYCQVLQCQSLIEVRREAVRNLEEHLNMVSTQYEIGTVAKSDVLASEVQLANQKQALTTAESDYRKAMATLCNIIGLPAHTGLALEGIRQGTQDMEDLDACIDYATENRADGIAARYAVKQAEANVRTAKAGYRPTVGLTAEKDIAGEGASFKDDHSEAWKAGVQASWNVFDNGITAAKVKEAQAALRKAESEESQTRETIELDVVNAHSDLSSALQNIYTTETAVRQAEEDYAIAQVRYVEGVDTNLAVMDAQEKLVEARTNYYTAIYSANMSRAQLDRAMGIPVAIRVPRYAEAVDAGKSSPKALADARIDEEQTETLEGEREMRGRQSS